MKIDLAPTAMYERREWYAHDLSALREALQRRMEATNTGGRPYYGFGDVFQRLRNFAHCAPSFLDALIAC